MQFQRRLQTATKYREEEHNLARSLQEQLNALQTYINFARQLVGRITENDAARLVPLVMAVTQPMDSMFQAMVGAVVQEPVPKGALRILADAQADLLSKFAQLVNAWIEVVRSESDVTAQKAIAALLKATRDLGDLESAALLEQTRRARDNAFEILDATRQAAGQVGSGSLATHFADYAQQESRTANVLRGCAIATLLAIAAVAAWLLFRNLQASNNLVAELARLAVVVPLALLAGYLSREATRHRQTANWANSLKIQLLTHEAYIAPLPNQERDIQRGEFARRIFIGSADPSTVDTIPPTTVGEIRSLLDSINKLVRGEQKPS
jgi:hypothetical protein